MSYKSWVRNVDGVPCFCKDGKHVRTEFAKPHVNHGRINFFEKIAQQRWMSGRSLIRDAEPDKATLAIVVRLETEEKAARLEAESVTASAPLETEWDKTECIVCMTGDKTHLAFPCGHQCICEECSKAICKCPICRADVVGWTQVRIA